MATNPTQEEGFQQLLAAAVDAMFVVDERGNVLGLNPEAERLFGEYAQGEALAPPAPLTDAAGAVALPCVQRVT